ncbi:MAG: primosomal protein N' [Ruminococcaceae bacterium]|nr:primosomal protein N' [Oscillospiraceae bacterium]
MEHAVIVKVAVSAAPYAIDKPYDYLVPDALAQTAVPGVRVIVPFGQGNRKSEGFVLARNDGGEKRPGLKPLDSVLDDAPILDSDGIALALWMRQRYFCTMFEALKTILPAGLWYRFREIWHLAEEGMDRAAADAAASGIRKAPAVLDVLFSSGGKADLEALRNACGDEVERTLKKLQKAGVVTCEATAKRKINDKTRWVASLTADAEDALAITAAQKRSAPMRHEIIRFLSTTGRASAADICYFTGASMQSLRGLEKMGILALTEEEALRVPLPEETEPGAPICLNGEQEAAFASILSLAQQQKGEAILLHGVTGSGKTQVYLRLVQEVLKQGKTAIVLVPEIVLTPQMMQKFTSYFGSEVGMLHSSLRMSERYDQWKRIKRGEVKVVLGTRSAIFAPLQNLGLIILDEEQEGSYQSENAPRYHTREIAMYLCAKQGAILLLGSATPAVETAWAAEQGLYQKALLRSRYNENALPQVTVADLRQEIRRGNSGLIGEALQAELTKNIANDEQSILFLNRRGSSRMLLCGECGHVPECPRCSVPLTYHSANERLMCHYCGHSERTQNECPVCGGIMKRVGCGTQKVEEELRQLFPEAGILRMDADTASGGHRALLERFERERIPILLGTQMVAKGLDFENVTLVGVLSADTSLYVDHYRAAERTFNLLTQVVGRAGRGGKIGRAVIQTYTPENDVIQCAASQDYARFYESEIRMRRLRRYPPFADIFTVTVSGTEEGAVLRSSVLVREQLKHLFQEQEAEILGPAPAPVLKLNNRYRYRCTLVGRNNKDTRDKLSWLLKEFANDRANRGQNIFVDCNVMD